MHLKYQKANKLTRHVIAGAIEVHKDKGPGLLEPIYEWCLIKELELRGYHTTNQKNITIKYKGFIRKEPLRFDVLIEDCLLVEAKSVETVLPIHKAQLLSYMKLIDIPVGLLINFKVLKLTEGISRLYLPGANTNA